MTRAQPRTRGWLSAKLGKRVLPVTGSRAYERYPGVEASVVAATRALGPYMEERGPLLRL
jgi:hypothetical protein